MQQSTIIESRGFWDERTRGEKLALGLAGGFLVVATGSALAYAIASGGVVVVSGKTVVLIGAATSLACGVV